MCANLEIIDQVQSRETLRQFREKPKTDILPSIDTISYVILSPYFSRQSIQQAFE